MSLQQATDVVKVNILEYKMAILFFILFSLNATFAALIIALTNVTWVTLDGQGKFMVFVAVGLNITNTVMAFMSQQAKRIKQTGELFPITDDSTVSQQTTQITNQTTKITTPPTTP